MPWPVTAEMAWNSNFLRLMWAASFFSLSGLAESILVAQTIMVLFASGNSTLGPGLSSMGCSGVVTEKLASSLLMTLKSSTGSGRPDASDTSTR